MEIWLLLLLIFVVGFLLIGLLTRWTQKMLTGQVVGRLQAAEAIVNEGQIPEAWLRPYRKQAEAIQRRGGSGDDLARVAARAQADCLRRIDALIRMFDEGAFADTPETKKTVVDSLRAERERWVRLDWRQVIVSS